MKNGPIMRPLTYKQRTTLLLSLKFSSQVSLADLVVYEVTSKLLPAHFFRFLKVMISSALYLHWGWQAI